MFNQGEMMNPLDIITYFYPDDTKQRKLLIRHSEQVRDKALQIAKYHKKMALDKEILINGAMLHDIGIGKCNAPDICCEGEEHYLRHGILGAEMLREYGKMNGLDLEVYARICERHTGSGLTAEEIRINKLPLPERDFLPETPEEKLICLADKFYSKSGTGKEKKLKNILRSMERFGEGPLNRFRAMGEEFHIQKIPPVTTAFSLAAGLILFDCFLTNFTTCLCTVGHAWMIVKYLFLAFFLLRVLYFSYKKQLLMSDVWIYQIFFLILLIFSIFSH